MSNKSIQELKRIASEKITNVIVAGGVDNKIEGELFENILEILDKRLSTIDDDTIQGLITFSNGLISNAIADFKVGIKVTGKADIQNLTTQIAEITEKLIVKLIEAENIDLSGSIKSKSAEITEKLAVCLTEAENITVTDTLTAFMSVIRRLTAKTAVIEQEISSIDYVESLLGWYIRQDGTAQLKGLKLLEFLEAPEFRYNRVTVLAGESWRGSGAGLIESVDEAKQIVYLKLEAMLQHIVSALRVVLFDGSFH